MRLFSASVEIYGTGYHQMELTNTHRKWNWTATY